MGFFSWLTQDNDLSVSNYHSSQGVRHVKMIDNKGNVWHEQEYNGYGRFGDKDFFDLFAEMNDVEPIEGRELRIQGIDLYYSGRTGLLYPNIIEGSNEEWQWVNEKPKDCPYQGYFY